MRMYQILAAHLGERAVVTEYYFNKAIIFGFVRHVPKNCVKNFAQKPITPYHDIMQVVGSESKMSIVTHRTGPLLGLED